MFLFSVLLAGVSVSVIVTGRRVEKTARQERIVYGIVEGVSDLSYLSNEYLMHRESQHLSRWASRFASFADDVASLDVDWPEQQALVASIQANQRRLKDVFAGIPPGFQGPGPDTGPGPGSLRISWSRLAIQSRELASDASQLAQLLHVQTDQLKRTNLVVILAMIGLFGGYFLVNHVVLQWGTLRAIARLQAGARVIGSGDLDFRFEERRNDEIGDLSRAFNRMTTSLNQVTARKSDLEREIAGRQRAEEQLQGLYEVERELRQEREREIERRAEFLRALVHELKTPLTPVLASSGLLVEEVKEEVPLRLAKNVHRGAEELNGRIDELLDLARGEMGMLKLNLQPVPLLDTLQDAAASMVPLAMASGQSLSSRFPDSLPPVMADSDRVRQVLLNLIGNAIKFTPAGGAITLSARATGDRLLIEVQDTGRGIDEEEQKQLFQPYHRLLTGRDRSGGLGLGLALSKKIVELHGGKIWVASRKEAGSIFAFSLPVHGPDKERLTGSAS